MQLDVIFPQRNIRNASLVTAVVPKRDICNKIIGYTGEIAVKTINPSELSTLVVMELENLADLLEIIRKLESCRDLWQRLNEKVREARDA
ncbi:MAG: hypothetical protein WC554_19565 [Clostridia bacterium]|jgi:hypothetical protein